MPRNDQPEANRMTQPRPAAEVHAEASSVRLGKIVNKIDAAASVGKIRIEIRFSDIEKDEIVILQQLGYELKSFRAENIDRFEISW